MLETYLRRAEGREMEKRASFRSNTKDLLLLTALRTREVHCGAQR